MNENEIQAAREQAPVSRAALAQRQESAYMKGYDERMKSGLEWSDGGPSQRLDVAAEVATAKVGAYQELDQLGAFLDNKLGGDEGSDLAPFRPLSPEVEDAFERASYLAGRWSKSGVAMDALLEAVEDHQYSRDTVGSIHAVNPQEAAFGYTWATRQSAEAGLIGIDRTTEERAAAALSTDRPGVAPLSPAMQESAETARRLLDAQRGTGRSSAGAEARPYRPPASTERSRSSDQSR
jgi:hypothetical protein